MGCSPTVPLTPSVPKYRRVITASPLDCHHNLQRINGRAKISTDPTLTESFAINGKVPKCVLVVTVERAYFQCTKAIIRSKLWDPASKVDRQTLPTPGSILAELTDGKLGGPEHDRLAPERIKQTIY